jgi:cytochrome b561
MGAQRFKSNNFFGCWREASHRNRRQQSTPDGGPWNRSVAYMAHLAMLFVRLMSVPVAGRLHGKQAHGKNQGDG